MSCSVELSMKKFYNLGARLPNEQHFLQECICIQGRLRSACVSAQSVQFCSGYSVGSQGSKRLKADSEDSNQTALQADLSLR